MSLNQLASSGGRWTAVSAAASVIIQFAQLFILGRLLSPVDFGLMAMMMVVVGTVAALADFGFSNHLVRTKSLGGGEFTGLVLVSFGWAGLLALGIAASAPWVSGYFKTPLLRELLPLLGIVVALAAVNQIGTALLQRVMRFRALALAEAISAIGGLGAGVLFAVNGMGVWSLVAAQLAESAFKSVLCWAFARDLVSLERPVLGVELAAASRFGAFQMGERLLGFLSWNVDKFIVGRMLGSGGLGIYSVAYQLVLRPLSILNPVFTRVTLPLFCLIQDDDRRLRSGYLQTLRAIALLSFPIYLVIAIAADSLIYLLLGPQWKDAARVLPLLTILGLLFSLGNPIGSLLLAKGRADLGFYFNLVAVFAYSAAVYIGSGFGVIGVALGLVIAAVVVLVPLEFALRWILIRMTGLEYLQALGPLVGAVLIPLVLVFACRSVAHGSGEHWLDLVEAFAALVVFLAVVWLTERDLVRNTLQMIHSR